LGLKITQKGNYFFLFFFSSSFGSGGGGKLIAEQIKKPTRDLQDFEIYFWSRENLNFYIFGHVI